MRQCDVLLLSPHQRDMGKNRRIERKVATITTKPPEAIEMKDMKEFTCNCLRQPQMHVVFTLHAAAKERLHRFRKITKTPDPIRRSLSQHMNSAHHTQRYTYTCTFTSDTQKSAPTAKFAHTKKNKWLESKAQSRFPWTSIINLKTCYGFKASNKSENLFVIDFWLTQFSLTFQNLVIRHIETTRKLFDKKTRLIIIVFEQMISFIYSQMIVLDDFHLSATEF